MADQQQYAIEDNEFKHEDTTHVMKIRFLAGNRFTIYPDKDKSFVAKVGTANGVYLGTYPVSTDAGRFIVKSADLKGLGVGDYRLEIWEKYTDSNGEPQTRIFPSPKAFVNFTINKNIEDSAWDLVRDISFQDLVNTAVVAAGQNIVVDATNTLPAGSQASVTQKYENGKNEFTFNIPQGPKGDTGKPFSIAKAFPSKDAMNGDGLSEGDFVIIASNVDDPNNATLFTWTGSEFKEIADLSGAQGPKGDKGDMDLSQITVGGRNLLVGTRNFDGEGWHFWNGVFNQSDFQGLTSVSNTQAWSGAKYSTSVLEKQGKLISTSTQYVLSAWVNNTGTSAVDIHLNSAEIDSNNQKVTTLPANSGWVRIASKPFRFTKTTGLSDEISFNTPTDVQGGVLKQAGLKLEIGNVATDWTPAPEDAPSNDPQLVHKTGNETIAGGQGICRQHNACNNYHIGRKLRATGYYKRHPKNDRW